jgi:ubiquinone/menaquinone biosynthesis C-methylase UbiE
MRCIPFGDETFDYVYENYSMCHLSKPDTALAVGEMNRVLKRPGMCFLGVISKSSWPKAVFGQERNPGEYWSTDGEETRHSMFTDEEADELLSSWEIVSKQKQTRYLLEAAREATMETWMDLHQEAPETLSRTAWHARYASRLHMYQYAHLHFVLRKR